VVILRGHVHTLLLPTPPRRWYHIPVSDNYTVCFLRRKLDVTQAANLSHQLRSNCSITVFALNHIFSEERSTSFNIHAFFTFLTHTHVPAFFTALTRAVEISNVWQQTAVSANKLRHPRDIRHRRTTRQITLQVPASVYVLTWLTECKQLKHDFLSRSAQQTRSVTRAYTTYKTNTLTRRHSRWTSEIRLASAFDLSNDLVYNAVQTATTSTWTRTHHRPSPSQLLTAADRYNALKDRPTCDRPPVADSDGLQSRHSSQTDICQDTDIKT